MQMRCLANSFNLRFHLLLVLIFQVLTQNRYKANKAYTKVKTKAAAQTKNFALQAQLVRNQVRPI